MVDRSISERDLKIVGLREIQKSIDKSSKSLVDAKIKHMGLESCYQSIQSEIRKKVGGDSGLFYFQGMNDLTADNIKSLEGFKIAWFEEAQNCTRKSLQTLRPTIREKGSQIIFTWNPKFPDDAIDEFCDAVRGEPDVLVIHVNYEDNPFISDEVLREVSLDRQHNPEDFDHIWLGQYDTTFEGHYYAQLIEQAKEQGRVSEVPRKTGADIITAWDLGRADATAIWVAQIIGLQVRIIDHIEDHFKDLDYYVQWIKDRDYNGFHGLPFDAGHKRLGMQGSIADQLKTMGLNNIRVMPAMSKDAGRRLAKGLIKEAYFDAENCKDGLQALRHEKAVRDEKTGRFKEVHELDSAAAFRYLAQFLEIKQPKTKPVINRIPAKARRGSSTSWMA